MCGVRLQASQHCLFFVQLRCAQPDHSLRCAAARICDVFRLSTFCPILNTPAALLVVQVKNLEVVWAGMGPLVAQPQVRLSVMLAEVC